MKAFLSLLALAFSSTCYAQSGYIDIADIPAKLGNEQVPAYRTFADTASKPFTKLFAHSELLVFGRQGRWVIVSKNGSEYVIQAAQLPADARLAIAAAKPLKEVVRDPLTGEIVYSEVIQAPGASQAELYLRAKLWFVDAFKSARAVVQADEREAGLIQGRGWRSIYTAAAGFTMQSKLWYTVKLALKDGRYKYDISDFQVEPFPSQYYLNPSPTPIEAIIFSNTSNKQTAKSIHSYQREMSIAAAEIEEALKLGMAKPATGTSAGKSDW